MNNRNTRGWITLKRSMHKSRKPVAIIAESAAVFGNSGLGHAKTPTLLIDRHFEPPRPTTVESCYQMPSGCRCCCCCVLLLLHAIAASWPKFCLLAHPSTLSSLVQPMAFQAPILQCNMIHIAVADLSCRPVQSSPDMAINRCLAVSTTTLPFLLLPQILKM